MAVYGLGWGVYLIGSFVIVSVLLFWLGHHLRNRVLQLVPAAVFFIVSIILIFVPKVSSTTVIVPQTLVDTLFITRIIFAVFLFLGATFALVTLIIVKWATPTYAQPL
ncbi:hypothetical protein PAPYR_4299 [Paratrimastix pyriformis]|uniref:NADH dehydrogenase subunit 6 n=1 Tax=Paratrimastix pyriformis TaxID=342808 RepID=A0ABQ8UPW4_9EUKA|nr:hypothetical protein PAPYR_4299 [Paratrimastix pyriformis]